MSHYTEYTRYPEDAIREIDGEWEFQYYDTLALEMGRVSDGYGYHNNFKIDLHEPFANYNAAYKYLSETYTDYNDGAVRFCDSEGTCAQKKKLKSLEKEIETLDENLENGSLFLDYLKSLSCKFITCTNCGSKIAREYLIDDDDGWIAGCLCGECPVCEELTMVPEDLCDRYEQQQEQLENMKRTAAEIRKNLKPGRKTKVCWLVKTEVHT